LKICGKEIQVSGRLLKIGRLEGEGYVFLDDPEQMLNCLEKSVIRIDLFTFMQRLPETTPKFAHPMEWDNVAFIPVSTFDHWWAKQIEHRARVKVRKAEKSGVVVREMPFDDALVQGIWEIYNDSPVRQGKLFRHYGKDLAAIYREEATFLENSIFLGAFFEGKMIGFVKMVVDETRTQARTMNIISMVRYSDKAPTNALIAQAVRICAERGIPNLVYGKFAYGKKQRDGISNFKQRNGFQRIDLPRYYVSLTPLGWAAFKIGLHHRFVDWLPESAIAKLRQLRKSWYDRKFRAVTQLY
jgi:hypothetical protein